MPTGDSFFFAAEGSGEPVDGRYNRMDRTMNAAHDEAGSGEMIPLAWNFFRF
jgi:hypothetical protein